MDVKVLRRELRDAHWDLFLLYRSGRVDRVLEDELWGMIERLEGLLGDG